MFCLSKNCFRYVKGGIRGSIPSLYPQRVISVLLYRSFSIPTNSTGREGAGGRTQLNEVLFHPDAKSVYVHTFGCSHNTSDGEIMKGLLAAGGYNITMNKDNADVWYG